MMFSSRVVPFLIYSFVLILCVSGALSEDCSIRKTSSKLFCYYSKAADVNSCKCTHVVLPVDADLKAIEAVRSRLTDVKVLLTVNTFSESVVSLLNATRIDGLDLRLTKLTSKSDLQDLISTIRTKLRSDLLLTLSVPARPELLAKYYDFKALSKHVDSFILETAFLGASGNVTFHPSRLSGVWDVQNTDSVVDLVTGLGAPLQKLVISAPVQAFKFTLQDAGHTAPGSPALELSTMNRKKLCDVMSKDKWMLERDQDQAGPYIFRDTTWIAFEDPTSIDIKSKYLRIRGLAGLALRDLSQDSPCIGQNVNDDLAATSILAAAHSGLTKQSRAPRGAVLQSLEREILSGQQQRLLDTVQVSPYRITRVVDTEGKVHAIRQDTRTEFECSRQGYFVHPRSCGRFYRCVKFDQLLDEYSVFEFDCPAGLVFDARVEVCVWPGSLPQASACAGSSEIAPVPRERFICPGEPGYYADPENCRWFFACLDHGRSPLSAYEFRCPFGLVFDQDRLLCEWPWLVPKCASGFAEGTYEEYSYGGIGTGELAGSGYVTTEDDGLSKTGLVLGQFNGLGSLSGVALGGLSGPLAQQIAKTYSSFNSGKDIDMNGNVLDYKPIGTSVFGDGHQARLNDFVDDSHLLGRQVDLYKIESSKDDDFNVDVRLGNFASGSHQDLVSLNQGRANLNLAQNQIKLANFGATSYANVNQEHTGNFQKDKINIIGGGFSAVGSGIELTQHGSNIEHVTPLPIEGSSTIATITSVPIPILQSTAAASADFDLFKGGVVANIPSLQYKINPGAVNTFFNQQGGYSTANSFNKQSLGGFKSYVSSTTPVVPVAFVSSTPVAVYNYDKVAGGSNVVPSVVQGYDYPKPAVAFVEEKPAVITTKEYLPPATVQPPVVVTKEYLPPVSVSTVQEYLPAPKPIQPVSSGQSYSYSHQNQIHAKVEPPVIQIQQSIGYEVPQRNPEFVRNAYNYAYQERPGIIKEEGYSYPKPTIKFEEIPKINQVFSYSQQPKPVIAFEERLLRQQAYLHPNPTIKFEEKPSAVSSQTFIEHNMFVKPIETKIIQPLIPVAPKVVVQENVGYSYPKSAVQFVEEPLPQVVKFDQDYQYRKPSISSHSFIQQQPQVQIGYEYPKPQIKFEEKPSVNQYIPPKVVQQGYAYPKPAITFEEGPKIQQNFVYQKPHVTQYINPLLPKVVSQGYDYSKPAIAFESKHLQPAVSSQSYVQHHTFVKPLETKVLAPIVPVQTQVIQPANYGYSYPKPSIKFEQTPQQVYSQYNYIKPVETKVVQPVVPVQQSYGLYAYPKPVVKFEEKPAVIQQTYVTPQPPAVVHIQQENIGYAYPTPAISFEEKPVQFVTPKPVVHVQQNIGYEYPKPAIQFEQTPQQVYSQYNYMKPVETKVVKPIVSVQQSYGYAYPKPAVKFEDKPVVLQQTYVTPQPPAVVHIQQEDIGYAYPKPAIRFEEKPVQFVTPKPGMHVQENIGYKYPRPAIQFEQKPIQYVTPKPVVLVQQNIGYEYPKPAIRFQEKPVVVHQQQTSYVRPVVHQQQTYVKPNQPVLHVQENIGYEYSKPAIRFAEKPVTPKPVVHVQQNIGYEYPKPAIRFGEKPVVVHQQTYIKPVQPVSTYSFTSHVAKEYIPPVTPVVQHNIGYAYPKPAIRFEEKPVVVHQQQTSYVRPIVHQQQTYVQPVQPVVNVQENIGYEYPKPAIRFEEKPVQFVTPKPDVHVQENIGYEYPRPGIHFEQKPIQYVTPKPVVHVQQNIGYEYPKPAIRFEEKPVVVHQQTYVKPVQPVSTYSFTSHVAKEYIPPVTPVVKQNIGYAYPKPAIKLEERPVNYNTYNYQNVKQQQQQVVYEAKPIQPAVLPTYTYQEPRAFQTYQFQQKPVVKQEVQVGYDYPKPQIKYEETPIITYENRQPVQEEIIVPKKAYVTGYQKNEGYVYNKTSVALEEVHYDVTARPTYVSTIVPKIQQQQTFYSYDNRFETKPQQVLVQHEQIPIVQQQNTVVESKPIFKYEFSSLDNSFNSYVAPPQKEYLQQVVSTTQRYIEPPRPRPVVVQQYSTPKPQIIVEPYVESEPIAEYEFGSFDSRFEPQKEYVQIKSTTPSFQINVPDLEYLPVKKVVTQPPRVYLPAIERILPPRVYLPASTTEKVSRKPVVKTTETFITIPKRTYLPVTTSTTEAVLITKSDRGYLPVKTAKFIENYEAEQYDNSEEVVSRRPVKVVKIVRPKSKSIVKVNDFHPILSTKLGAQCTCTSNTLRLRKPAKKISIEVEPDTRISDLEEYVKEENESGDIIIEDYQYEPQKLLDDQEISVTRSPGVILRNTTEELYSNAPAPNLVIKKRLRGRPISTTVAYEDLPVSRASDLFIRRSSRPRPKQVDEDQDDTPPNSEEIVDAVRTGLKLVKSAVKEGVKEGIRESNLASKTFDRFGPGGVRSRSETLQGTIDCQRAGLFRHPNHCNKFYACRWDCKKNRFTLHVFNCPVHLTFDNNLGACNWPSQGPACVDNTLLPNE